MVCNMFEYNKNFWEKFFSADDSEEEVPHKTYYMLGIAIGFVLGGTVGFLFGYPVPLAALGAAFGMWIGNEFKRKT